MKIEEYFNIKINSLEDQILDLKNNERNLENFSNPFISKEIL